MSHGLHTGEPVVRISQLSKRYGHTWALQNVDLAIHKGERVALLGASGSGKSTLLRCLCGLEIGERGSGRVDVLGQRLQSDGRLEKDVRHQRRRIGVIFQQFNLVGRLPVMTNVLNGSSAGRPLWRSLLAAFTEHERAVALEALHAVGLGEQAWQRASTLSGGQQQRAAIARVLVQGASLLLADEPVASLDPESTRRVMDLLELLNRREGLTLVISLHHVELARRYCDRVVALRQGRLVFDGPTDALSPRLLKQLYGDEAADLLRAPDADAWPGEPEMSGSTVPGLPRTPTLPPAARLWNPAGPSASPT